MKYHRSVFLRGASGNYPGGHDIHRHRAHGHCAVAQHAQGRRARAQTHGQPRPLRIGAGIGFVADNLWQRQMAGSQRHHGKAQAAAPTHHNLLRRGPRHHARHRGQRHTQAPGRIPTLDAHMQRRRLVCTKLPPRLDKHSHKPRLPARQYRHPHALLPRRPGIQLGRRQARVQLGKQPPQRAPHGLRAALRRQQIQRRQRLAAHARRAQCLARVQRAPHMRQRQPLQIAPVRNQPVRGRQQLDLRAHQLTHRVQQRAEPQLHALGCAGVLAHQRQRLAKLQEPALRQPRVARVAPVDQQRVHAHRRQRAVLRADQHRVLPHAGGYA
ncbi:hypothetical protein IWW55_002842 [Coemansia sp. RSA 2706]|nr:hypothetical protein IWW55_002842 [Coemansia sp. RSA 2706]